MEGKGFRAAITTGTIHNLGCCCYYATRIKPNNFKDFYCWDEAEAELKMLGKQAKRCLKCGWPHEAKKADGGKTK